jgi:hypothetical protein
MKRFLLPLFCLTLLAGCQSGTKPATSLAAKSEITAEALMDKIRGAWAGQVIGCTFGGPTEFGYKGTMIPDYQPVPWDDTRFKWYFDHAPGLYDDVYMDLTFLEVMEKEGIDAPASSHALAFANAPYPLWHANQAARYNILNGVMPPASGYWEKNPHSDDIDFQIEADFAGIMSPGMPNAAAAICDKVGHIMNYGDGWYGGVYMAAMYSLAFISDDIGYVVEQGLKTIPAESDFYKCIREVIDVWEKDPADWKKAWFAVESRWACDRGCPEGVFRPFNIDAKVNAAYVVIGLLYGGGDFARTLQISTRCGQDSDCNPASAGGILGTMIGYDRIPGFWKDPMKGIEEIPFAYTSLSLKQVYETSYKQAVELIRRNGGSVETGKIALAIQDPAPVKLEQGFAGHYPVERRSVSQVIDNETTLRFEGTGFVLTGQAIGEDSQGKVEVEVSIDGMMTETFTMPVSSHDRRHDIAWRYGLNESAHEVKIRVVGSEKGGRLSAGDLLIYRSQPYKPNF